MLPRGTTSIVTVSCLLAASLSLPAFAIEHNPKTVADLRAAATDAAEGRGKIRVLIAPGHEPNAGGTAYMGLKERDLVVQLGKNLQRHLTADGRFEAILSRDEHGWHKDIAALFSKRWDEIDVWRRTARADMDALIATGKVKEPPVPVNHNDAPPGVAIRLYGTTKWANENDIDVMVHIHFDDDRASNRAAGRRTGFAVYVPPPQYFNGPPTRPIAEKVLARLSAFDPVADMRFVGNGIVEDPQLIAVGRHDTSDVPSMLIEYAFIYEQQLRAPAVRALALDDMAFRTSLGLRDFFFPGEPAARTSSVLPYDWKKPVRSGSDQTDIFALQTAMTKDGVYPPAGKTKHSCPRNGVFGPCTRESLKKFQAKHGITGENGFAGKKTLEKLRAL